MRHKKLNKKIIIILIVFSFISCSPFSSLSKGQKLNNKEGAAILSFNLASTMRIKAISFDLIGNNETKEIDIEFDDDNLFFIVLKKGYYQIQNIKASLYSGGYGARDNPNFISIQKLYFKIEPNKINYLGHINIREVYSRTNANVIFRGKYSYAYIVFDINFNNKIWEVFKSKYPEISKKYKMVRNLIRFGKPRYVRRLTYKRFLGIFIGRSGVNYKMTPVRVKEILKQENREFDVISLNQIVEKGKENSIIRYLFSDNNTKIQWRGRLYRIIEETNKSKNEIVKKLNKHYKKISENKWQSSFDIIELKKQGNKYHILYTSKKYLKR